MCFEEIQSIWNSQKPVEKAVDETALLNWIRSRDQAFARVVGATEIVMVLTLLFVAAMFFRDPLVEGHDRILMVAGLMSLLAAAFVWSGRVARRKRVVNYDDSLLGIVEKSLDAVNYQQRRMQSFVWWFAAPMSVGLLIAWWIVDPAKRYLFYTIFIPGFVLSMALAYWQIGRENRRNLAPEKARLEGLRDRLRQG